MKRSLHLLIVLLAVFLAAAAAPARKCAECGMTVNDSSPFSARLVSGKETLFFCDIGDLFVHLNRTGAAPSTAEVRDHPTGAPLPADRAFYVKDDRKFRTPMGWGIAAFASRDAAAAQGAPLDIAKAREAVK